MAVLVEFITGVTEMLRDVGNACLSLALVIYGFKFIFTRDPTEREESRRMLLAILVAFILINLSDRIIEELLLLV